MLLKVTFVATKYMGGHCVNNHNRHFLQSLCDVDVFKETISYRCR